MIPHARVALPLLALAAILGGCGDDPVAAVDAGSRPDAFRPDAGLRDSGAAIDAGVDAGTDAAPPDSGPPDAGQPDTGPPDVGPLDAGSCCDRLGTTTSISWNGSDAVLPQDACPPWTLIDSATPEEPVLDPAGFVRIDISTDGEAIVYRQDAPAIAAGATVVLDARMRLVSGATVAPSRAPAVIAGVFGPMRKKAALYIGVGLIFLLSEENTRGPMAALDTTTAPHDYRIEIDLTTNVVRVLVDGVPTLTGTTFTEPTLATDQVFWGGGSIYAHGSAEWHSFQHDAWAGVCTAL